MKKLTKKQKLEIERLVSKLIVGWQIPIMELSTVYNAAEAAYRITEGPGVGAAVQAVLEKVAVKS
jgi:hypothetical protein